jgi:hypothetical protein
MPCDKAHAKNRLDLAAAQRVPRSLPERRSVVRNNPDPPDNIQASTAPRFRLTFVQLAFCGQAQPVRIGRIDLIAETGKQALRG